MERNGASFEEVNSELNIYSGLNGRHVLEGRIQTVQVEHHWLGGPTYSRRVFAGRQGWAEARRLGPLQSW